jgi:hypothetical protein
MVFFKIPESVVVGIHNFMDDFTHLLVNSTLLWLHAFVSGYNGYGASDVMPHYCGFV